MIAVHDEILRAILFSLLFACSIVCLLCGLSAAWRIRHCEIDTTDPRSRSGRLLINTARITLGSILGLAGISVIAATTVHFIQSGDANLSPLLGSLWLLGTGYYGLSTGIKRVRVDHLNNIKVPNKSL